MQANDSASRGGAITELNDGIWVSSTSKLTLLVGHLFRPHYFSGLFRSFICICKFDTICNIPSTAANVFAGSQRCVFSAAAGFVDVRPPALPPPPNATSASTAPGPPPAAAMLLGFVPNYGYYQVLPAKGPRWLTGNGKDS